MLIESAEAGLARALLSDSKAAEVSKNKVKSTLDDHVAAIEATILSQKPRQVGSALVYISLYPRLAELAQT